MKIIWGATKGNRVRRHFLNSFANASRALDGGPEEVSRSTTVRGSNSSQVLGAFLFTIFAVIGLLHSNRAPGSKYAHCRQACSAALHVGQVLSTVIFGGAFAPHAVHFTASPNAIIRGERGPSRSFGRGRGPVWGFGRSGSRSLSL